MANNDQYKLNDGNDWAKGTEKGGFFHHFFGRSGADESEGRKHGHLVYNNDNEIEHLRFSDGTKYTTDGGFDFSNSSSSNDSTESSSK